jgi:hypothetical protein
VDISPLCGNLEFAKNEQTVHDRFENSTSKALNMIEFTYSGAEIGQQNPPSVVTVTKRTYIDALEEPDVCNWDFANVHSFCGHLS